MAVQRTLICPNPICHLLIAHILGNQQLHKQLIQDGEAARPSKATKRCNTVLELGCLCVVGLGESFNIKRVGIRSQDSDLQEVAELISEEQAR